VCSLLHKQHTIHARARALSLLCALALSHIYTHIYYRTPGHAERVHFLPPKLQDIHKPTCSLSLSCAHALSFSHAHIFNSYVDCHIMVGGGTGDAPIRLRLLERDAHARACGRVGDFVDIGVSLWG